MKKSKQITEQDLRCYLGREPQFTSAELCEAAESINLKIKKLEDNLNQMVNGEKNLPEQGLTLDPSASARESALTQALDNVVRTIVCSPGKRVRPLLILWCEEYLSNATHQKDLLRAAASIEALHAASLAIDDIQDQSHTRRGAPAAHVIHGTPLTLNASCWSFFAAIEWLGNNELKAMATQMLMRCHEGQALDLLHFDPQWSETHRKQNSATWKEHYLATAAKKTGTLMTFVESCVSHILELSSSESQLLNEGLRAYGTAFQILDDLKIFVRSLSGDKTYEDLEFPLRNWALINYLADMSGAERSRFFQSLDTLERPRFEEFFLELSADPRFSNAVSHSLQYAAAQCAKANEQLLGSVCLRQGGNSISTQCQAELHLILTKPASDLLTAIEFEFQKLSVTNSQVGMPLKERFGAR